MTKNIAHWDALADVFGQIGETEEIPTYAADNILIAWPSLLAGIDKVYLPPTTLAVLDYGCGGGLFCRKLHSLGHHTTGCDISPKMMRAAQHNMPSGVTLADVEQALTIGASYDLITSIMVLPFVEDLEELLARLVKTLRPRGSIFFASFNPAFVHDNAGNDKPFTYTSQADVGSMELKKGVKIPFYIRSATGYQQAFAKFGMTEVYRDVPPFTPAFLEKYPFPLSTAHPEFLIMGFRA